MGINTLTKENSELKTWDVLFKTNVDLWQTVIASQLQILLVEEHCKRAAKPLLSDLIQLQVEPSASRAVYAKVAIEKETLVLVPVSLGTACGKEVPNGALDLGDMGTVAGTDIKGMATMTFKIVDTTKGQSSSDSIAAKRQYDCVVPFWIVGSTPKSSEVNMEFRTIKRTIPGDFIHSGDYYITVLVNSRPLEKGDVLKYQHTGSKAKFPSQDNLKQIRL